MGVPPSPPPHIGPGLPRIRHLVGLDPGGAWIADHGGRLSARASRNCARGTMGLSLLVVTLTPVGGAGRSLLARSLGTATATATCAAV